MAKPEAPDSSRSLEIEIGPRRSETRVSASNQPYRVGILSLGANPDSLAALYNEVQFHVRGINQNKRKNPSDSVRSGPIPFGDSNGGVELLLSDEAEEPLTIHLLDPNGRRSHIIITLAPDALLVEYPFSHGANARPRARSHVDAQTPENWESLFKTITTALQKKLQGTDYKNLDNHGSQLQELLMMLFEGRPIPSVAMVTNAYFRIYRVALPKEIEARLPAIVATHNRSN